jgi:glycosyltransferase involved in cell wall biosynthesis
MQHSEMISITILVKNGERTLRETLESLKAFSEVILYDTGSSDQTLQIAKEFNNVKIVQGPFLGFGKTHNVASKESSNNWILSIDSDEVLTEALLSEILTLELDDTHVYSLKRMNFFNGKEIKWCGWQNDAPIRLYNRNTTSFSEAEVHEGILTSGKKIKRLKGPLKHYPYASISDFLQKMEHYSTLFAKEHHGKRKSSPLIAWQHGVWAFLRSYFLKKGFMGGYEGFLISLYNAHTAYYKYLKLYHLNATSSPKM